MVPPVRRNEDRLSRLMEGERTSIGGSADARSRSSATKGKPASRTVPQHTRMEMKMTKFLAAFLILGLLASVTHRVAVASQAPQDRYSQDHANSYAGGSG